MTFRDMDDKEILALFRSPKGEDRAFRLLVEKYGERLYWHVRKIVLCHEDADDVLQNALVKVWQGLRGFREESRLFTWMYRVATNEALNFLEERRRGPLGRAEEITPMLENRLESDVFFDGDEIERELQRAVLRLPERQWLVFNMKYFDGMKYEDMSEVLGVTVGGLKATYHNAVKRIEAMLRVSDALPGVD